MIAGLDSSFTAPTAAQADAARAAGVRLWCGYLATRSGVGLAAPWSRGAFDNARRCGGVPLAYCSGQDDPVACRQLAAVWQVRLCLDVEPGIRSDGAWVQSWLDSSGAGLYGLASVHPGRRAPYHVVARYPGRDPGAYWPPDVPRPAGWLGWQWQGSHSEFGCTVDRGWFDDSFQLGAPEGDNMADLETRRAFARILSRVADGMALTLDDQGRLVQETGGANVLGDRLAAINGKLDAVLAAEGIEQAAINALAAKAAASEDVASLAAKLDAVLAGLPADAAGEIRRDLQKLSAHLGVDVDAALGGT